MSDIAVLDQLEEEVGPEHAGLFQCDLQTCVKTCGPCTCCNSVIP